MTGGTHRASGDFRGTFVIPLDQVEIDGIRGAPAAAVFVGSQLRLRGEAVRIDGPADLLTLGRSEGSDEIRRGAQRSLRRLLGNRSGPAVKPPAFDGVPEGGPGFTVTDGGMTYQLTLVGQGRLFALSGPLPPQGVDLVVIDKRAERSESVRPPGTSGVVCFASGTRLATADGLRPVETIQPGDKVLTRDSGAQEVLWIGGRRLSGARLFAMPHLRPVRMRSGALGETKPEGDLMVSPEHRILLKGARARDLFNEDEVLVAARDLIDDLAILRETGLREVTYIHLLTARHEIVWANGVECETFHPAGADLLQMAPEDLAALKAVVPGVAGDPFTYGDYARRSLAAPEAAILRYAAA